jgi:hypothetical protein
MNLKKKTVNAQNIIKGNAKFVEHFHLNETKKKIKRKMWSNIGNPPLHWANCEQIFNNYRG